MASKWAHLKEKLPALPVDPSYEEALVSQMAVYQGMNLAYVAQEYNDLEEELAEREKEIQRMKLQLEAASRVLGQKMEDASLESAVMAGYKWTPKFEPYPQVKDKAALRAWVDDHMSDNLSLPFMTLKSVVKDALEAGDELPPGVEVFLKRSFSRTKA